MNKPSSVQSPAVEVIPATNAPPLIISGSAHLPALKRAIQMANNGDCRAALQLLRPQGHGPETLNAVGVCLLRLGQVHEAIALYRGLVMKPGCTWMRPEVSTLYKTNFAMALLMAGTPAGCLDVLGEIRDPGNSTVQALYAAIKRWEASLSFWRRWDWRINRIDPPNCRIPLDFPPGEFLPQTVDAQVAPLVASGPDWPVNTGAGPRLALK